MKVIYRPTGKSYDVDVTTMKDIINVTDTISPAEQFQWKSFDFVMNTEERNIVVEYFKRTLASQWDIPYCDVEKKQPKLDKIYIDHIGTIYLKSS